MCVLSALRDSVVGSRIKDAPQRHKEHKGLHRENTELAFTEYSCKDLIDISQVSIEVEYSVNFGSGEMR